MSTKNPYALRPKKREPKIVCLPPLIEALMWEPDPASVRRLVIIDTASRLAIRILNGRKTMVKMPVPPETTPEQIEDFRAHGTDHLTFRRIVKELQENNTISIVQ